MEELLGIITINYNGEVPARNVMIKVTYIYIYIYNICDVTLPQYNEGYVYMLISIKDINIKYIGK